MLRKRAGIGGVRKPPYKKKRCHGWTKEELACLKKWYKHYSSRVMADILVNECTGPRRKANTIHQKAYMLGLKKSIKYRREVLGHKI